MKALIAIATFSLSVSGGFVLSEAQHSDPAAHFTAHNAVMTSPARLSLGAVDITISQWSTDVDRRRLVSTFLLKGRAAFTNLLCSFGRAGSITVDGEREMTLRYAWETTDGDGGTRVYLAADEPIRLDTRESQFVVEPGPLTFVELRMNRQGDGEGKLAPVEWLSVDERESLIEISNYDLRPLDLLFVHREGIRFVREEN